MGPSFMDRIREHKTGIIQVIVVLAVAVAVSTLMITMLAATKGDLNAETARVNGEFDKASTHINTLGTQLNDKIDAVAEETEGFTSQIDTIGLATATNSHDIGTLQVWRDATGPRITALESQNSPPEGYLTGTVGNYTLHAKCDEAGNFTANVYLVYSPTVAVGNTTHDNAVATFYGSINWTAANTTVYVPTPAYNGTNWGISHVSFNIGIFAMTANNVTVVPVVFAGLNSTYAPNFAYVEVWPVLK